jgi:ABC-type transport system involved in cytochrome c biogenesis permease component
VTFLPIVDRELRVAARNRFTFWSRVFAAAFALVIFVLIQILAHQARGAFPAGQVEFAILKWMAFIFALSAGLFLTSDCLSEEKREGTLGLLFLTDLRGYDVVLGKLLSQSLRAVYALLAAFPIMGLALLSGGVTGGEFWRSILVICNTLIFSLALGMLVSAISRDSTKAMNATLFLCLLILAGLPFADFALAGFVPSRFHAMFSLASPGYLFTHTDGSRFGQYWICLVLQNALAWAFLAIASLRTPHAWQEKSNASEAARPSPFHHWRFGEPRARAALRRRFLDENPILWLALRDRWLPRFVWMLTLVLILGRSGELACLYVQGTLPPIQGVLHQIAQSLQGLFVLGLVLWVASQASRFFVDAVRNGALELVLVTPASPDEIVRGQWNALWRTFLFPAICVAVFQIVDGYLSIQQMIHSSSNIKLPANFKFNSVAVMVTSVTVGIVTFATSLVAVSWFGMWMGLTNRKNSVAVLKTVCFVFLLPWLALVFVQIFISILGAFTRQPFWFSQVIMGFLSLGKDAFFFIMARHFLLTRFREAVIREERVVGSARRPSRGPLPPPVLPPSLPPLATTR